MGVSGMGGGGGTGVPFLWRGGEVSWGFRGG